MLFTLIAISLVPIIWWVGFKRLQKDGDNIRQLAKKLGFTEEDQPAKSDLFSPPEVTGALCGRSVRLFEVKSTGSRGGGTIYSGFSVYPRINDTLTFSISHQGLGTEMLDLVRARKIATGDPEFDRMWSIQTNQPDLFLAALAPELREKLKDVSHAGTRAQLKLFDVYGTFKLENGGVHYSEMGDFSSRARCVRFEKIADVVCDLAEVAEVIAQSAQPDAKLNEVPKHAGTKAEYTLHISGERKIHNPSAADITSAAQQLNAANGNAFLILSTNEMSYVQCSGDAKTGFDLEYQTGEVKSHFRATRDFRMEEIVALFTAYLEGDVKWKDRITWAPVEL
jgi:hypothetical protein